MWEEQELQEIEEEELAEEEERVAEEAQRVVEPEQIWEEGVRALQQARAEAAKLASPNPGACYHCRNRKWECVRPR